jgi:CSLREA domain-containing protein
MGGDLSRLAVAAFAVLAFLGPAASLAQASITVTTTTDEMNAVDGKCSLREAVAAANAPGGPSSECPGASIGGTTTIALSAGTYFLTLGQLHISTSATTVALQGLGRNPAQTSIHADSAAHARALQVDAGAQAALSNLTVTGGLTATTPAGGNGGDGGGIYNDGTLTLTNVVLSGNTTGPGGDGVFSGGPGGRGGNGGGIFNSGTLTLTGSTLTGSVAGHGGLGTGSGLGGTGGNGGAVYNTGTATLINTTLTSNHAGNGGAGGGSGSTVPGGAGGAGGAIYNSSTLTLTNTTLRANTAGSGGAGGLGVGTGGAGGRGGDGGGIYEVNTVATLTSSTIAGNASGGGGNGGATGGANAAGGAGGAAGGGGGLFGSFSSFTLTNTTVAGNTTGVGGTGGFANSSGNGGDGGAGGDGGGVLIFGTLNLTSSTVSANATGGGGAGGGANGPGSNGSTGNHGAGGGIDAGNPSSASEVNTLVASNQPQNCLGAISDGHHNLSYPDSTCRGVNGDPKLGALADNGGPTQTMGLLPGSAAIDQVPATGANCPATDQRGIARPQPSGGSCDIGAYEFVFPPVCQSPTATTGFGVATAIQLSCADGAAAPLSYAIDANPAHGSLSGLGATSGLVTYTPNAGYAGADAFTYHATSANGTATSKSVSITVSQGVPNGVGAAAVPNGVGAAAITGLRIKPSRLIAAPAGGSIASASKPHGNKHTRKAKPTGTTITYTDSKAATTTLTVIRILPGISSKHGCIAPPRHSRKHVKAKACIRLSSVGIFSRQDRAGANSFHFTGRVNGRKLARGKYRLQAAPTLAGRSGAPATSSFTIVA